MSKRTFVSILKRSTLSIFTRENQCTVKRSRKSQSLIAGEDVGELTGAVSGDFLHEGTGDGGGSGVISATHTRGQAQEAHQTHMSLEGPLSLSPRDHI